MESLIKLTLHLDRDTLEAFRDLVDDVKEIRKELKKMSAETQALLKKIDDATTAIGVRIQKLIDSSNDPELNAALQREVDTLTKLGSDPNEPIPGQTDFSRR